ncbi:substrate-binding domain-containing protein [Mediterraneibacter sp. NSJ-151]|uniref:substrate-binding domain-containing protein n=1 Tax=Mediterraneibacter sp. NSJ-151 TaxID=2897708 RepID=UPI001F0A0656|nr:substrate-binding domain-containing protein [Mediterraneibacter sp. NSJ-151]MCH4280958.1 substrate-binding domain-containing protein [Mediterraneibacter sp. NSJ-151]
MKKRWMTITAVVMATTFMICACGKQQEQTTTFTGKETEKPEYQGNLNAISPAAYNNVEGLNLEPGTYISIIGKDDSSSYWTNVKKGVMQAADDLNKELGYKGSDKIKVTYNAPAKSEDIDEQVNILDEELSRYPDAVGIASIDSAACSVQFDLATANGIPVISLDSGNEYKGIQCIVKTDNEDAARTGAYKLANEIGDEGQVILVVHDSNSETAKERAKSFEEEIKNNYPSVSIVETIYCDKLDDLKKKIAVEKDPNMSEDLQKAAVEKMTDDEVMQYYLEKYPDLKGVFGTNESSTIFALEALQKTELAGKVALVGFDISEEQIAAMKNGEISGLVVQNPFGMGYASVVAAARTILQSGNEAVVDTGYIWVTKDNLEDESIQNMLYK